MTEPIRLLHFSDVHIGMENYGRTDPSTGISSRVMDFLRSLNTIIEFAEQNEADLAIFSGDAFKSSSPNPTYQREFARRIKRLAKVCPVVLLVGNHDIPAMAQKASSIEIFHTLAVDNVIVGRADEIHRIETRRGPAQVATVPYPVRQRLLSSISTAGMSLGHVDALLSEQVDELIRNLANRVDDTIPAVLAAHLTVQGARLGSERGIMLGRDVSVLLSTLADPIWDYVALGHIHYHQDMNFGQYPPVVYSGSIERVDFGEEGDAKGFVWAELARGKTTFQFIELEARPFITIRVDVRKHRDPTKAVLKEIAKHDVTGAVVRVIITTTPENDPHIRQKDIEAALGNAGFVAAIQRDIDYPVRARLGVERPEELSPLELLDLYLVKKGTASDRIELLKEYAERIMEEETSPGC
ncbi:MAG: exonuclease SbcCD subunit D [Anaerolineae bacterium]|nr:exonuclease SbcCD subunit D [Anaerolineae bacterium]